MPQTSKTPPCALRRRLMLGALPLLTGMGVGVGAVVPAWAQQPPSDDAPSALARIRASGALKVALYHAFAPFSAQAPKAAGGGMQGLDVSLAQALAQAMGLQLSLLPFDAGENMNDDLRNMVWKGHYLGYGPADVMLHVPIDKRFMQHNPQALIFAPYMREHIVLLHDTQRLPQVSSAADLQGLPLAAERGTAAASALIGQDERALSAQVRLYDDGVKAAASVLQGQAAAAYVSRAQAEAAIFQAQQDNVSSAAVQMSAFILPGVAPQGWSVGMAVKAKNEDLGQALQQALQTLRDNGQLQALFKQHGLTLLAP